MSAFDTHDTPSAGLIDACVHCGFCLPSCPTYVLWGEEMDSPRGRIYLMKAGLEGRAEMNDTFVEHFDRCLGCMACVTACPSGVQYGPLIERTRAQIERRHSRSPADRLLRELLFRVLPYPWMLRLAMAPVAVARGVQAILPARLKAMLALAPRVPLSSMVDRLPAHTPAAGTQRMRVGMLAGCVQRVVFPEVNRATIRVLAAEGCETVVPGGQGCCGALSRHAGRLDEARDFARRTIERFEAANVDRIVVNAAGCGSSMKEYGELFDDDPIWHARAQAFSARVRDVSELLVELGEPRAPRHPVNATVAYHDACHLGHAQGIRRQPRELLAGIPGVTLVEVAEPDICCGSAGIYNLVQPEAAAALGDRKARHIDAVQPDLIVTGNPGCTLQIGAALDRVGARKPVLHPIELLDRSIRGTPWSA
jgi:glycolate oxidase iron-sulfur subunit